MVVGAVAPVACALFWWRAARVDRSVAVRTDAIVLLRQVPMLRPLPVTAIERWPRTPSTRRCRPGVDVIGPATSGTASTSSRTDGSRCSTTSRVVRTMGPGEGFGEIALLGRTVRTMTVRAVETTRLLAISAGDFLPAVTGISEARAAAELARPSTCGTRRAGRPTTSVRRPE